MNQKVQLDVTLVQAVVNYLGARPFAEVADLVLAIREQVAPQLQAAESGVQDAPVQ